MDGLDIEQTAELLRTRWRDIRQTLLSGRCRPSPVRRVMIPKPDGSQRELGIPTVLDRLIQQALLQVLQPLIDKSLSEHSHGFRPGRRATDAVKAARAYVQSGKRVVVDVDLAKFFDRVNHDILIDRLRRRIEDAGVIRLVRAYLLGWKAYFGMAQTPKVWRELDEWLRHRLRAIQLRHWKRSATIYRELKARGATQDVAKQVAANGRRWWRNSAKLLNSVLSIAWFDQMGLPRLF